MRVTIDLYPRKSLTPRNIDVILYFINSVYLDKFLSLLDIFYQLIYILDKYFIYFNSFL